jgi:hypothetical protein
MRNISDWICGGNQNTHFVCIDFFFPTVTPFLDNVGKYGRVGQATNDNMAHENCMLDKATRTHSEYGIFIPFPQQQRLY